MYTTLNRPENTPTGDSELDDLLELARELTGMNWQCNVVDAEIPRLLRKPKMRSYYWLVYYDGGSILPWRMILNTGGDLERSKAYLVGLITGVQLNV